jgi:hypothetical protein
VKWKNSIARKVVEVLKAAAVAVAVVVVVVQKKKIENFSVCRHAVTW